MNGNRRLQERKQPERRVLCKIGAEKSGAVLNLSEDGFCFGSVTPIAEKDLLHVRLSVDLNGTIEATGQLAWIDSAKRTVGLRFLELSMPAREQIRAWLSETSSASFPQTRDKQADNQAAIEKPPIWQVMRVPGMQLVPIDRYRAKMRWQFLRGVLLGIAIWAMAVVIVYSFRNVGGTGGLRRMIASPKGAPQSSTEQRQSSTAHPVSPSASISDPAATKPLPAEPAKAEQPLAASQAAAAPGPAAAKAHSSSGQVQHAKKVSATPQQLWSAVEAGNLKAAITLADLYARGEGVPVNCEQARVLLLMASEKNDAEASRKLRDLDRGGCPANHK